MPGTRVPGIDPGPTVRTSCRAGHWQPDEAAAEPQVRRTPRPWRQPKAWQELRTTAMPTMWPKRRRDDEDEALRSSASSLLRELQQQQGGLLRQRVKGESPPFIRV